MLREIFKNKFDRVQVTIPLDKDSDGDWVDDKNGSYMLCGDALSELFTIPTTVRTIDVIVSDKPIPASYQLQQPARTELHYEGRWNRVSMFWAAKYRINHLMRQLNARVLYVAIEY